MQAVERVFKNVKKGLTTICSNSESYRNLHDELKKGLFEVNVNRKRQQLFYMKK